MTTYYVGIGGNDGNDGTTWALRKLTLNGAEDIPVAAGDTVYVGPGTYREMLTVDVSGADGQIITYIGDVTGEHTDGVGGVVRVTGSDNDQLGARAYCVTSTTKTYRTFPGFTFDSATTACVNIATGSNYWIIEDCMVGHVEATGDYGIYINSESPTSVTIRRCAFAALGRGVYASHSVDTAATDVIVENCALQACIYATSTNNVSGLVLRNLSISGGIFGVHTASLAAETSISITNSIITGSNTALYAAVLGDIIEDYNNISCCITPRTNVTSGANSAVYITYPLFPPLLSGQLFPAPPLGALAPWSQLKGKVGATDATEDFYGMARPATAAKISWGAVQYQPVVREATTTHGTSAASMKLADAGRQQFIVPVDGTEITVSLYCYREADYAGTLPQMVVRQPGQSARTTVDTGDASTWNLLTDTFTPAGSPDYIIVEVVSNNTAAAGDYDTFFDSIAVS